MTTIETLNRTITGSLIKRSGLLPKNAKLFSIEVLSEDFTKEVHVYSWAAPAGLKYYFIIK